MGLKLKGSFKNILFSLLFLVIAVAAASYIYIGSAKTRKIVKVPVLKNNVEVGMVIKESDITNKEIGEFKLDNKIIKSQDELIGKYAIREIFQGRYLYKEDISDKKPATEVNEKIKYGALAVTTDLNKCVGGILKAGDYVKVNIIKKKDANNEIEVVQYRELSKVKVIAIENSYGEFINSAVEPEKNGLAAVGSNQIKPATVVFDAEPGQEKKLLEGEYLGDIHLVLLPLSMQDEETDVQPEVTSGTEEKIKPVDVKEEVGRVDQEEDKQTANSNEEVKKEESTGFKVN